MSSLKFNGLRKLFEPKTIAIIGASADLSKTAGRPLHYLKKHGFSGKIWPVNPNRSEIDGVRCFPSTRELPGTPDVGIVMLGPDRARNAVEDLSDIGAGIAIVMASGYAETGPHGAELQTDLVNKAKKMRLLGPNTIGTLNLTNNITLSASGALDVPDRLPGKIAIISQSGGILGSLLSRASEKGIGLSHLVATGNEADLDVADIMLALGDDPETGAFSLYLETIRNKTKFEKAVKKLEKLGKAIVAYKVGRSEAGMKSIASHTGALAGSDDIYTGFFKQTGIIRAQYYTDLLEVPMLFVSAAPLKGKRLGILTTTGGAGGLIADVCGNAGFKTPAPDKTTAATLEKLLSHAGFSARRNPIDLTLAGLKPDIIRGAIQALLDSPTYDAVVSIVGSSGVGQPGLVADPVIEIAPQATKPIIVYTSPAAPGIINRLNKNNVPAFDTPEACASALSALYMDRKAH
jgi:acyl-CoA synthetase (NDP forming)